jgi:hypothetical protein
MMEANCLYLMVIVLYRSVEGLLFLLDFFNCSRRLSSAGSSLHIDVAKEVLGSSEEKLICALMRVADPLCESMVTLVWVLIVDEAAECGGVGKCGVLGVSLVSSLVSSVWVLVALEVGECVEIGKSSSLASEG